jgi:hypothetical protein
MTTTAPGPSSELRGSSRAVGPSAEALPPEDETVLQFRDTNGKIVSDSILGGLYHLYRCAA